VESVAVSVPVTPASAGPHARRVIFIDLGRALAVVFMLYGHTASALLAVGYQAGPWFEAWQFQRGLTSTLFLLLGGFAFSVATSRHWTLHASWSPAIVRRLRRFALFVVLGYALHFPVGRFVDLPAVGDARWRTFMAVDVLQLIGFTLIALQLLVLIARTRRRFTVVAFASALVMIVATPFVWNVDWTTTLPVGIAAYLNPGVGSLFPLFPWMGFVMLGAGFGQIYARWGAANLPAYANRVLLLPGAVLLLAGGALRAAAHPLFGQGPGTLIPSESLVRLGTCLLLLAGIAHISRRVTRLPHVFGAVAQESLLIYFVHLCIVYGSVWNHGLTHFYGAALDPLQTIFWVVTVLGAMVGLAWYWNWWKHVHPRVARWMSFATLGYLAARLV
jgi:uncharacterized membrane protein